MTEEKNRFCPYCDHPMEEMTPDFEYRWYCHDCDYRDGYPEQRDLDQHLDFDDPDPKYVY